MPRTKIICTIGPATESPEVLGGLVRAGLSVARVNFGHGDHKEHAAAVAALRKVAKREGRPVAVMGDLQGPKLRVGQLPGGRLRLVQGEMVDLVEGPGPGSEGEIPVPHPGVLPGLRQGQRVLLDDGALELIVREKQGQGGVRCEVVAGGELRPRKGINVPGADLCYGSITDKDRRDVQFAVENGFDFLALSYVCRAEDVEDLRHLLAEHGAEVPIVAKIEKPEALSAFDAILRAADGVMVARGDLGIETPAEEVPFHQKRIIRACNRAAKPVITATQMLQSMIDNPRPTRAEASDVANAILDGTDGVMLSGETAVGAYPVVATETMAKICANAEAHLPQRSPDHTEEQGHEEVTWAISSAAVDIAAEVGAKAIITATMSGTTARMVARRRPRVPVVAVTPSPTTLCRLALVWGVEPVRVEPFDNTDDMVVLMLQAARQKGVVGSGDQVVLTAGIPFGQGQTNLLKVHTVA
jgi:pyruvate kinase